MRQTSQFSPLLFENDDGIGDSSGEQPEPFLVYKVTLLSLVFSSGLSL
jgi:hypothetical protein